MVEQVMRICLISQEYPTDDHGGGIGTYTEKTARALARLGQTVDVVTESVGAPSSGVEEGVTIHRLAPTRWAHLRTLDRARRVAATVNRLDPAPDIVQACEFRAEAVWWALTPARTRRRPRLVTRLATPSFVVRDLNEHGHAGSSSSRSFVDRLERLQTRRSDGIIAISEPIADVVCAAWDIPRSRVTVVRTGVDFAARHAGCTGPLPEGLGGVDYLLYFGRLEERKGVHILARALPAVLAAHPGLHAVLAGAPLAYQGRPMDDFVRECNRDHLDRIHLLPRQPQPQLHQLLTHALVVVLPSLWEGLGNVALETIDMGKPVVATSGSGFSEVIEDGRSGLLVPPGDVDALRQALGRLLDDPPLRDRLAQGARARAARFELGAVAAELLEFYRTVTPAARTSS